MLWRLRNDGENGLGSSVPLCLSQLPILVYKKRDTCLSHTIPKVAATPDPPLSSSLVPPARFSFADSYHCSTTSRTAASTTTSFIPKPFELFFRVIYLLNLSPTLSQICINTYAQIHVFAYMHMAFKKNTLPSLVFPVCR